MFEVWSNFSNNTFVNAPDSEKAILRFKQEHPKTRSLVEAKECSLPMYADIFAILQA